MENSEFASQLLSRRSIRVAQVKELVELFGYETRNKYSIEGESGDRFGYCAEQHKGVLVFLCRQFMGHWRSFELHGYDRDRREVFRARHPFRFLFQRLEVTTADGRPVGAFQQRFSVLYKKFDVLDASERVIMTVASPIWKIWTFTLEREGRQVGVIQKRWSGLLKEAFTDADNFEVRFDDASLGLYERLLILAGAIFVDLNYFERKAKRDRRSGGSDD